MDFSTLPWFQKYQNILSVFSAHNEEARFVGGCIRDALLGKNQDKLDIDIATTAVPEKVIDIFEQQGIPVIPTGLKHGTVSIIVNKQEIQITTLRRDEKCDGRHAIVSFTQKWTEDAQRRDLSFNALYCDQHARLYDYFHGIEDLEKHHIKFIGNPEQRIKEDFLRILRAFRFYSSLQNATIDEPALRYCQQYADRLNNISGERIKSELFKILKHDTQYKTIFLMQKYDVLPVILPIQNLPYLNKDIKNTQDPIVLLASLLYKTNYHQVIKYLKHRLKLSNKEINHTKKLLIPSIPLQDILDIRNIHQNIYFLGRELFIDTLHMYQITHHNIDIEQYLEAEIDIPSFPLNGLEIKEQLAKHNLKIQHEKIIGQIKTSLELRWVKSGFMITKPDLYKLIPEIYQKIS